MGSLEAKKGEVRRRAKGKEKRVLEELEKIKNGSKSDIELKAAVKKLLAREFPKNPHSSSSNIFMELQTMRASGELSEEKFREYTNMFLEALPENDGQLQ